ncbi:hypothetical protein EXIGLDRAFT_755337 [Exidia glandulosa HHB12029]|uniref:F-box domain-containing protein n=1 Tax=Exidia glandulosa HHB12029 TaxID=1314781 RepID=A0A165C4Y6_EXIGL|nr:hypothetical protein EXIGLDRAFT_755337 [Exidia glandulosa HHB12029]
MSRSSADPTPVLEPPQPTISPDLERELSSVVLSVFQKTLALAGPTTVDIITQTVASVQRCVTTALAPELRTCNGRLASTANLPNEVLCMIWQLLCVEDRVKVSHVCSSWRSLAIDTPRLWAELDFCCVEHDDLCLCSFCRPHSSIVVPRPTNLGICSKVLPRSRSVPLSVHVEFARDDTPFDDIVDIAESLEPHCQRLEGLFFVTQKSNDVADFLNNLSGPFPTLRTLHCTTSLKEWHRIILPPLPNAETILMRSFALEGTALHLPSLRSLHCAVHDENDVLGILDGCPKLETLALETQTFKLVVSHAPLESFPSRASRLRELVLRDVDHEQQRNLLVMFHPATLRSIRIHYNGTPPGDFMIFHDLEATIEVVVSEEACEEQRISVTDSSGRTRAVQSSLLYGSEIMTALWGHHDAVTALTLPANLWYDIQPLLPVLPGVRSATFSFDDGEQYAFVVSDRPHPLPGLEHLRLVCFKQFDTFLDRPLVPVTEVAQLISFLKGSVDTLTIEHIDLDGDREELASLVRELRILSTSLLPTDVALKSARSRLWTDLETDLDACV